MRLGSHFFPKSKRQKAQILKTYSETCRKTQRPLKFAKLSIPDENLQKSEAGTRLTNFY